MKIHQRTLTAVHTSSFNRLEFVPLFPVSQIWRHVLKEIRLLIEVACADGWDFPPRSAAGMNTTSQHCKDTWELSFFTKSIFSLICAFEATPFPNRDWQAVRKRLWISDTSSNVLLFKKIHLSANTCFALRSCVFAYNATGFLAKPGIDSHLMFLLVYI